LGSRTLQRGACEKRDQQRVEGLRRHGAGESAGSDGDELDAVATINAIAYRSIGSRVTLRTIRYQMAEEQGVVGGPRKAAPAASWKAETAYVWRPVPAIAVSVTTLAAAEDGDRRGGVI
jgi:hypothetical protein